MIYLDWAATAIPDPEIIDIVKDTEKKYFGNPSSIHSAGRKAKKILIQAKRTLSDLLNVEPSEIIFNSGGTEANNMVLFSHLSQTLRLKKPGEKINKKIIVSSIEHPSVYNPALLLKQFGYDVVFIHPGKDGRIILQKIEEEIDHQTRCVSCMYVNNETGAIQPIKELGTIIDQKGKKLGRKILFHVDAVQALGKIPFFPHSDNIDTASMSAHKIGGSKGTGALFIDKNVCPDFLYKGGDQEEKQRPGTENIAGIQSISLAAKKAVSAIDERLLKVKSLMNTLISGIAEINGVIFLPETRRTGNENQFSPYILKIAFPEIPGEVLVRMLEDKGIIISTGSACSSQKKKGKHRVMENMGIPGHIAESSVRISLGNQTTENEIDTLISRLKTLIPDLKKVL